LKDYNDDRINLEQARQLYSIRISELHEEFLKSEKTENIREYPTPLRDIYEEYIMADLIPDDVFNPSEGCDCFSVFVLETDRKTDRKMEKKVSEKYEDTDMDESQIIEALTSKRLSDMDAFKELVKERKPDSDMVEMVEEMEDGEASPLAFSGYENGTRIQTGTGFEATTTPTI
jgi:hypothetical protein